MSMLIVENDGPDIVATNYWGSQLEQRGTAVLSIKAEAFRLLVPQQYGHWIEYFEMAKDVVITRGPFKGYFNSIELLFYDGTEEPVAMHLIPDQIDRLPPKQDEDSEMLFTAWILRDDRPHCAYRRDCYYRYAWRLPWLKPRPKKGD